MLQSIIDDKRLNLHANAAAASQRKTVYINQGKIAGGIFMSMEESFVMNILANSSPGWIEFSIMCGLD
jgi:hypothetical protein